MREKKSSYLNFDCKIFSYAKSMYPHRNMHFNVCPSLYILNRFATFRRFEFNQNWNRRKMMNQSIIYAYIFKFKKKLVKKFNHNQETQTKVNKWNQTRNKVFNWDVKKNLQMKFDPFMNSYYYSHSKKVLNLSTGEDYFSFGSRWAVKSTDLIPSRDWKWQIQVPIGELYCWFNCWLGSFFPVDTFCTLSLHI